MHNQGRTGFFMYPYSTRQSMLKATSVRQWGSSTMYCSVPRCMLMRSMICAFVTPRSCSRSVLCQQCPLNGGPFLCFWRPARELLVRELTSGSAIDLAAS